MTFKWMQIILRFLAVLYEVAALAFLGYLYATWRSEPSVRVDVLFPSFFPVSQHSFELCWDSKICDLTSIYMT